MSGNRTLYYFWILFLCLCSTPKVYATFLKQYTTNDHLASNLVYCSYTDSKGFIWFCTDKGLSRFDGVHFRNFTTADGLSDNEVFRVLEDLQGRLWLFTFNGEPCFYLKGKFYTAANDPLLRRMPVLQTATIRPDNPDGLYFAYWNGGILKIDLNNNITWIRKQDECYHKFWDFIRKDDTIIAIAAQRKYYIKSDRIVKREETCPNMSSFNNGRLLISRPTGISVVDSGSRDTLTYHTNITYRDIQYLHCDDHHIYISCFSGLLVLDRHSQRLDTLLKNVIVNSTRADQYNNIWVCTRDNGVYCLNPALFRADTLFSGNSFRLTPIGNTLFFQHGDDLYYVHTDTAGCKKVHVATIPQYYCLPQYIDEDKLTYSPNAENLFNIYYRKEKRTLSANFGSGIKRVFPWKKDTLLLSDLHFIYKVYADRQRIFVKDLLRHKHRIERIYYAADKRFYYISDTKLLCYDPGSGILQQIDSSADNRRIESLFVIDHWLIACDNQKRIRLFDLANAYKTYTLPCDYIIYSIQPYKNRQYLLETQFGYVLAKLSLKPPFHLSFTQVEQPFQHMNLQFLFVQGNYLAGTVNNRLIWFNRTLLDQEPDIPRLFVEQLEVNGKNYAAADIKVDHSLSGQIRMQLKAIAVNRNIHYHYRIQQGVRTGDWYITDNPELDILLAEPGNYTIELKAVSINHKASLPVFIHLKLIPPFLHSPAFYLLAALLAAILLALLILYYVRRKKRAFLQELQHLQLEHKAVNALMNPHFIFNVVNNIQDLINNNSKESANSYLATMSKMIRQNIENLQFNLIPLKNELDLIHNYINLQNLRFGNRIQLHIEQPQEEAAQVLLPPLLLHPFVENAVIHGFNNNQEHLHIDIRIQLTLNGYLSIEITDDGKGLNPAEHSRRQAGKTSLGIDFNRKRLERISGFYKVGFRMDISDRAPAQRGTAVHIILYARFDQLINASAPHP